jgi:glucose/arabinose dehydrogenase
MTLPILLGASHLGGSGASRRRRASRVARLLLVLALSAGSLAAAPAPAQAATTATIYRPNHRVHFDAGTYTGYKFSASGTILAHKTATLSRASGAATRLRTTVPGHSGNWLAIVNGIWAGYSIHESNRTYLPFARLRLVAFAAGTHTGYKFNAAGAIVAHKTFKLTRASGASAGTQAFIGTKTYLLIVNGIWAGYWVPVGSGVGLKYPPLGSSRLGLRRVVGGLDQPLYVTNADDGTNRLFIVQRTGLVRVFRAGLLQSAAFLNLTGKISCCDGERGLLGLAFHPAFATNRRLFAYYTDSTGDIIVAEYTANAAGTSASASTERVLLRINHRTYSNHDGGWIGFGPDGYLYIATGDGGGGGDPLGNGQNRYALLGKILRINVNGAPPYTIPPTNPFANGGGAKEVWAYGLRNPWRDSFDSLTGSLFIGDVGQSAFEEVDRSAFGVGGQNYGWNVMEGFSCYNASTCARSGKTLPIAVYSHGTSNSIGCAITGGYMYRGAAQPALQGHYIFGDFCTGRLWTMYQDENVANLVTQGQFAVNISSFGQGETGEVYLTDLSGGVVYRVVVNP